MDFDIGDYEDVWEDEADFENDDESDADYEDDAEWMAEFDLKDSELQVLKHVDYSEAYTSLQRRLLYASPLQDSPPAMPYYNLPQTVLHRASTVFGPHANKHVNHGCDVPVPPKIKFTYIKRVNFSPTNTTDGISGVRKVFHAHHDTPADVYPTNVVVNRMLYCEDLPNGLLQQLFSKNWHFYVKMVYVDIATFTLNEFRSLCTYSTGFQIFVMIRTKVLNRFMVSELAHSLRRAIQIDVDIDGMGYGNDWISHFHCYKDEFIRSLNVFKVRYANLNFSIEDFNTFMHRVSEYGVVEIYLHSNVYSKYKLKTVKRLICKKFAQFYERRSELDRTEKGYNKFTIIVTYRENKVRRLYFLRKSKDF